MRPWTAVLSLPPTHSMALTAFWPGIQRQTLGAELTVSTQPAQVGGGAEPHGGCCGCGCVGGGWQCSVRSHLGQKYRGKKGFIYRKSGYFLF